MISLFEGLGHAAAYAKYRPQTPKIVAEKIVSYMKERNSSFESMIDVGCGSGQSTCLFSSYFSNIIGVDPSSNQIEMAKQSQHQNIIFKVGKGENLPALDNSVDLIASGQAVHWCDLPAFFKECHRALKPNGCILLHGYDIPIMYPIELTKLHSEELLIQQGQDAMSRVYKECCFHERLKHLDEHYITIFDMIRSNHKVREDDLKIKVEMNLEDYKTYLTSWSGYQGLMKKKREELIELHGNDEKIEEYDVLIQFVARVKKMWGLEDKESEDILLQVSFDLFLIMSERPYL